MDRCGIAEIQQLHVGHLICPQSPVSEIHIDLPLRAVDRNASDIPDVPVADIRVIFDLHHLVPLAENSQSAAKLCLGGVCRIDQLPQAQIQRIGTCFGFLTVRCQQCDIVDAVDRNVPHIQLCQAVCRRRQVR